MMGSICCCFHVKDPDPGENVDTSSHGNCIPKCFISNFFNKYAGIFSSGQMHDALSSSNQEAAASSTPNGAAENTEADIILSPRNSRYHPESSIKFSLENGGAGDLNGGAGDLYDCASPADEDEDEDEDVCPRCLEEYKPENPKIITHCHHHYHLSCIYEWMERSETCPVCCQVLIFDEEDTIAEANEAEVEKF